MRRVWPFKPLSPVIESLEWATDVFRAKASEQRIALRRQPRRTFSYAHFLTDEQANYARVLIRNAQGGDGFYCPDWTQASQVGAVSSGSGVSITADLDDVHYGDRALIWESERNYEAVDITWDSAGIEADVSNNYTRAYIVPLWEADAPQGLSVERSGPDLNTANIAFILTETADLGSSSYEQYRGHDVVPDCPVLGGGSFTDGTAFEVSTFDNVVGDEVYFRARDDVEFTFQTRWHKFTRPDVFSLRQWLHSRRGKQKAFWLPTYAKDLTPAQSISGTTVTVYNDILGRSGFDVEIAHKNGTVYRRQVTGSSVGSPVNGRSTADLTIDSSVTIDLDDIARISYLICCRFDADRVELEHRAKGGTVVQMPCREVPVP
jgi:hypothetical protein